MIALFHDKKQEENRVFAIECETQLGICFIGSSNRGFSI